LDSDPMKIRAILRHPFFSQLEPGFEQERHTCMKTVAPPQMSNT
jgi:hypothetical protein